MDMMPDPVMARWLRDLVPRSRRRAERAQLAHSLPADHGERLFCQQRGRCAISGLSFKLTPFPDVLVKHPFAPSFDRISSRGGYAADNVRLVCIAVNFGMGQWGEELYLTFARAAVEYSNRLAELAEAAEAGEELPSDEAAKAASWFVAQRERLAAAELIASGMSGKSSIKQRRHIAALKRNLSLGPAGLKAAAAKAGQTRMR